MRVAEEARAVEEAANAEDEQAEEEELTAGARSQNFEPHAAW